MSLVDRMENHDAAEERRYLRDGIGKRLHLTWSWLWLHPLIGLGATIQPNGPERWSAYASFGPLTVEAYWLHSTDHAAAPTSERGA